MDYQKENSAVVEAEVRLTDGDVREAAALQKWVKDEIFAATEEE